MENLIRKIKNCNVEWRKLGEVVKIKNGKDWKSLNKGYIPVYGSGGIMGYVDTFSYDKPTVLIPRKGSITNIFYVDSPFWNVDTIYYTIIDTDKLIPKFFYYYMKTIDLMKLDTGSGRPSLTQAILNQLPIPIPPLYVQKEIVRILDAFTELTAELTARKKQYAYYRDRLLTFDEGEVEWKMLGEVGELVRGNGLPKKDFTSSGIPAIHYGQIYTYYGVSTTNTLSFVSSDTAKKLKKVNTGDVVITNTSENLEDVGKAVVYLGKEQAVTGGHATIFKPSEIVLGKYFAYFTQTEIFAKEKRKYAKGTKVIDVSTSDMAKTKIPIHPSKNKKRSSPSSTSSMR